MFIVSLSGSDSKVTLAYTVVSFVNKLLGGYVMLNPLGGVFATAIIVSFV